MELASISRQGAAGAPYSSLQQEEEEDMALRHNGQWPPEVSGVRYGGLITPAIILRCWGSRCRRSQL